MSLSSAVGISRSQGGLIDPFPVSKSDSLSANASFMLGVTTKFAFLLYPVNTNRIAPREYAGSPHLRLSAAFGACSRLSVRSAVRKSRRLPSAKVAMYSSTVVGSDFYPTALSGPAG